MSSSHNDFNEKVAPDAKLGFKIDREKLNDEDRTAADILEEWSKTANDSVHKKEIYPSDQSTIGGERRLSQSSIVPHLDPTLSQSKKWLYSSHTPHGVYLRDDEDIQNVPRQRFSLVSMDQVVGETRRRDSPSNLTHGSISMYQSKESMRSDVHRSGGSPLYHPSDGGSKAPEYRVGSVVNASLKNSNNDAFPANSLIDAPRAPGGRHRRRNSTSIMDASSAALMMMKHAIDDLVTSSSITGSSNVAASSGSRRPSSNTIPNRQSETKSSDHVHERTFNSASVASHSSHVDSNSNPNLTVNMNSPVKNHDSMNGGGKSFFHFKLRRHSSNDMAFANMASAAAAAAVAAAASTHRLSHNVSNESGVSNVTSNVDNNGYCHTVMLRRSMNPRSSYSSNGGANGGVHSVNGFEGAGTISGRTSLRTGTSSAGLPPQENLSSSLFEGLRSHHPGHSKNGSMVPSNSDFGAGKVRRSSAISRHSSVNGAPIRSLAPKDSLIHSRQSLDMNFADGPPPSFLSSVLTGDPGGPHALAQGAGNGSAANISNSNGNINNNNNNNNNHNHHRYYPSRRSIYP